MSKDKDVQDAIRLEDNIEYRFNLVREGKVTDIIVEMLKKKMDFETISSITGKSVDEIKSISYNTDLENYKVRLEDNIEYRFKLVEEEALERGAEEKTIDIIKEMLKNNIDISTISSVTGKSIQEIKGIEKNINE